MSGSIEVSSSNTLLGSHQSPKQATSSPSSSVTMLPLESRKSSPLAHKSMSAEELHAPATPKRHAPTPLRSTLQPSDAELSGRVNHDPGVNMFLEIPPSPLATSRPSTAYLDYNDRHPRDSYFPATHNGGQYAPLGAPRESLPMNIRRSLTRPISTAESQQNPAQGHHSQSASIVSATSDNSTQEDQSSSARAEEPLVKIPARAAQDERPRSRGREERPRSFMRSHPPRSSSLIRDHSESPTIRPQQDDGKRIAKACLVASAHVEILVPTILPPPRITSAVGDWGSAIFQEIDMSLQDSRSMAAPSTEKHTHHTSTLSDASSDYSTAQGDQWPSRRHSSIGSRLQHRQSAGVETKASPEETPTIRVGSRRPSNASFQEEDSHRGSLAGSHRNTRELSDFYDSYWRRSQQGQANIQPSSGNGKLGEGVREGKRPPPSLMEPKAETIVEVPSPVPSPMIGKAI